jgi:3'-phosphoadenosine 5'-phosphosulfate (PAPS) 3'-phosphatase
MSGRATRCCPRRVSTTDSAHRRAWIVDPLDGTREFSELGRDDWVVHVALWQAGELVAGAVALPAQGAHYHAERRRASCRAGQSADSRVLNPATRRRARGQGRPGRRTRRDGFCGSQSRIGRTGPC